MSPTVLCVPDLPRAAPDRQWGTYRPSSVISSRVWNPWTQRPTRTSDRGRTRVRSQRRRGTASGKGRAGKGKGKSRAASWNQSWNQGIRAYVLQAMPPTRGGTGRNPAGEDVPNAYGDSAVRDSTAEGRGIQGVEHAQGPRQGRDKPQDVSLSRNWEPDSRSCRKHQPE